MRLPFLAALAALPLITGCGTLGGFADAVQESGQLQQRASELDEKLDLLDQTLEAYGPIAESFGPEVQESYAKLRDEYAKVQGAVAESRELLGEATSLHQASLSQATDPESGETDWIEYALLMLLGGGGLASERMRTGKEKKVLHERIDSRKGDIAGLEAKLRELGHKMEVESARREAPPA